MGKWRINTDDLNAPRTEKIRGVNVTVYFGLEDLPHHIKCEFDSLKKKFHIDFSYDAAPETKVMKVIDKAKLFVGRNSERLLSVEIDAEAMNIQAVQSVGHVLDVIPSHAASFGLNRIDNYVAASGAFQQVRPQLEATLVN